MQVCKALVVPLHRIKFHDEFHIKTNFFDHRLLGTSEKGLVLSFETFSIANSEKKNQARSQF